MTSDALAGPRVSRPRGPAASYDAQWTCDWCKRVYVVPSFARDCEDRHLAEEATESP